MSLRTSFTDQLEASVQVEAARRPRYAADLGAAGPAVALRWDGTA